MCYAEFKCARDVYDDRFATGTGIEFALAKCDDNIAVKTCDLFSPAGWPRVEQTAGESSPTNLEAAFGFSCRMPCLV